MNDDQFDDLKQFITATVSQAIADLPTRDEVQVLIQDGLAPVKQSLTDLEIKVDTIADALSENLQDHEVRITKLEQQAA